MYQQSALQKLREFCRNSVSDLSSVIARGRMAFSARLPKGRLAHTNYQILNANARLEEYDFSHATWLFQVHFRNPTYRGSVSPLIGIFSNYLKPFASSCQTSQYHLQPWQFFRNANNAKQIEISNPQGNRHTSTAEPGRQSRCVQIEIDVSHISNPMFKAFFLERLKNAAICIEHADHTNDNV